MPNLAFIMSLTCHDERERESSEVLCPCITWFLLCLKEDGTLRVVFSRVVHANKSKMIWFNLFTLTNGTWNQKLSVYIAHANKSKMPKSTTAHFLFPNKPLYVGLGLGKKKLAKFRNMLFLIITSIIVAYTMYCHTHCNWNYIHDFSYNCERAWIW